MLNSQFKQQNKLFITGFMKRCSQQRIYKSIYENILSSSST